MYYNFFSFLLIISFFPKGSLSGNCQESDDGCLRCDFEKDVCLECVSHKYSNGAYCDPCDPKCKECSTVYSNCIDCYEGFYLKGSSCLKCDDKLCAKCVYEQGYKCTECQSGYSVYESDGLCKKCDETCNTCKGPENNKCTSCSDGYFAPPQSDSTQGFTCSGCATNCKTCHGTTISECDECDDGYFKSDNQCLSCSKNCSTCSGTRTNCTSCPGGFYLKDSVCLSCAENCLTCTGPESYECNVCVEGYILYSGTCQTCQYATGIIGCPRCKRNHNNEIVCSECPPGYHESEDNDGDDDTTICEACRDYYSNCLSCPTSTYKCEKCKDGYYIDSISFCSECEAPCLTCEGSGTACTSCIEGYFLNKEKSECEHCPANCLYCSSGTNCTTCNNTYYPVNGLCKDCHESCEYCHDDTNACDECREKFYFNQDKRCVSCPTHCNKCNSTYCFICEKDFYSVDGVCTPCADVCSHCDGPTVDDCIECDPGFYFSESFSACYKCDDSCATCQSSGSCTTCATGYYPGQYGGCYKCEMNCLECTSFSNCKVCKDGFRLYYRENENEPDCQPCKNRGCKSCKDAVDKCTECIDGYYSASKDSNNYVNCQSCPEGCRKCSADSKGQLQCTECSDEYFLQNGRCTQCSTPCATCSNENTCITCIEGFLFDGVSSCNKKCSPDCLTCESASNKCTSCHNEYVLAGSRCIKCAEGCKTCEPNYWGEGNMCTSCIDGYYMQRQSCVKCHETCATCRRGDIDSCTSCAPGYFFATANIRPDSAYTGQCSPCNGEGHENCELCIENCNEDDSICSSIPICTQCKVGYYVDDKFECAQCADNCAYCDGPNPEQCSECLEGYYNYNNKCTQCSPSCKTCDSDPNHCTSCHSGKYEKDGQCLTCDTNTCSECVNEASYCTKCSNDKYVYEGQCYSSCSDVKNGPVGSNTDTKECYKCILLDNCVSYDDSCQCTSCNESFYLSDQICHKCPLGCTSCSASDPTKCPSCFDGFYHDDSNNTCNQCDKSCFNCTAAGNNNCITCNTGYVMNDDKICERLHEGCDGNRCELDHTNSTTYENYTLDATVVPSFVGSTNADSGGAVRLINYGLKAEDVSFTGCTSQNGGGGGIYIYNNIKSNEETTYSVHLSKLYFTECKANFGAAVYIYSPSEKSPVIIEYCIFTSNQLTESSNSKLTGGSALYLTAKTSEIVGCNFKSNKGRGGAIKISDDFDIVPEGSRMLQKSAYNSSGSVLISDCSFNIDSEADCSLFYSNERQITKVEVNGCTFKGKLAKGAHYIDGKSLANERPNLFINYCKFETDQNGALNSKFIKIDLNNQLTSANNDVIKIKLSSTMLIALSTLSILAVVLIVIIIKRRNLRQDASERDSQESVEA